MADGDTLQDAGPTSYTIDDYLDQLPDKGATPPEDDVEDTEAEAEDVADEVEGEADTEEATDETEAENDENEADDPDGEDEEPQHLSLDEYGEVTIPVVIDGQEQQVTLAEAAKGYQRQQVFTRKTTEIAERERALKAEHDQTMAALAEKQRELDERLAGVGVDEQEPDWVTLAREDPLEYVAKREEWNQKKTAREAAQQRLAEQQAREIEDFKRQTAAKAVEAFPDWADGDTYAAGAEARRKAALAAGFTEQEFDAALDFRLAVLLEKAARYDAGRQKKTVADKKLSKAPKVLKPGRSSTTSETKAAADRARKRNLDRPHSIDEHLRMLHGD